MGDILQLLAILTASGQQAAEQAFGAFFSGFWMRYLAIGTTVGLACALKVLAQYIGIPEYPWGATAVIGVLAGLGANAWHPLLDKLSGGKLSNDNTLGGVVKTIVTNSSNDNSRPPAPPANPKQGKHSSHSF